MTIYSVGGNMTQQEALQTLVTAAKVAQQRGVFSLEEASMVHSAITMFVPPTDEAQEPVFEENTTENKKEVT
jgi:hypothetical protein